MSAAPRFGIVSPNFHPRTCGVGDNSFRLAREIVAAGYEAEIVSRGPASRHPDAPEIPVYAADARWPMMIAAGVRRIVAERGYSHVILQYTPQMWGAPRFGSAATPWLANRLRRDGVDLTLIAHELFTSFLPRPDLIVGAALYRAQIALVGKHAHRTFVTTDTRADELAPYLRAVGAARPGVMRISSSVAALPRARQPGRERLGVFSTLATNKRFDVVLGSFERVWRRRPASELVLIGDLGSRSEPRVQAVHAAIDAHPARARIRVTGKLSLAEVAREISELDVYLFPMTTGANTRSSTLPLALETGLPVVATQGRETDLHLFKDADNVLFAPALSAEAFGDTALRILEDDGLAGRLSAGARVLFDTHLSWPMIGRQVVQAILGRPAAPAVATA